MNDLSPYSYYLINKVALLLNNHFSLHYQQNTSRFVYPSVLH